MKKPKEKTLNLTWVTKLLNEDLMSRQGKAEVGDRINRFTEDRVC